MPAEDPSQRCGRELSRLRVLGCAGGELAGHRATSFLLDGAVAIDAGSLAGLSLDALERLEAVVLTHAHLDHVKDVPLVADALAARRRAPLVVHGSPGCVRALRAHLFNGELWPDFTRIPDERSPAIELRPFDGPFTAGGFRFQPVPMSHAVESTGYVVSGDRGALAISGDTGPTDAFWAVASAAAPLGALLVETSFPSRLQAIADASGHLTPRTLAGELAKLAPPLPPIWVYHLKPAHDAELRAELAALHPAVRILSTGDELAF
jgi:ribonuclease BN (tRNA processing enzyme)